MRQDFVLPSYDQEHLNATGLKWDAIAEGSRWLLLHDRPVPSGYTVSTVITALQIPAGYPDAQIDMVYFFPALVRADGKTIGAVTQFDQAGGAQYAIGGRAFQRWSRHRTDAAPWRAGEDDVASHLALVDDWLAREFVRNP